MLRLKLLDLFSNAGGAGFGYWRAGYQVTGVDIVHQPNYPFPFVQADALEYLAEHGHEYDVIHASPPCQRYSKATKRWGAGDEHEGLVAQTRKALIANKRPWVIENVVGAPLINPMVLCGSMFGLGASVGGELRQLHRHRLFESSVPLAPKGPDRHVGKAIGVYGAAGGSSARSGEVNGSLAQWREAMGIDWTTGVELAQAIPPAYSEWVGRQMMGPARSNRSHRLVS